MECRDVREQLGSYLDNELAPTESASLKSHLDQCLDCRQELEMLMAVIRTMHSLPRVNPPSHLHARIMAGVQREAHITKTSSLPPTLLGGWKRWTAVAAAVLLALMSYRMAGIAPHIKAPGEVQQPKAAAPAYSGQTLVNGEQRVREATNNVALDGSTTQGFANGSIDVKATTVKQDDSPPPSQAASLATAFTVMDQVPAVSTPNPSFSAPRDDSTGDRGMTAAKALQTSKPMAPAPLSYKEYVTQIRLATANPEEFRRRLYIFAQSEQLGVTEMATGNQTLGFTIRGSTLQMRKVETQLAALASIVEKESTVNDLQDDWLVMQEQITQLRLEYQRREDLLREARSSSETNQMVAELTRIRSEMDNKENSARLMQERFGTAVLELYLQ